jgi:hypothetical protein
MAEGPILVVNASVVADADEDSFNKWYTGQHISEVLDIDGFLSAERYVIDGGADGQYRYHTIYRIEPGRLHDARDAMLAKMKARGFSGHPGLAVPFTQDWYQPLAFRARGDGGATA